MTIGKMGRERILVILCLDSFFKFLDKSLHILLRIIDIEASAQRSTDTESLMKWICTVMSCSYTYTSVGKHLGHIIRMMIGKDE